LLVAIQRAATNETEAKSPQPHDETGLTKWWSVTWRLTRAILFCTLLVGGCMKRKIAAWFVAKVPRWWTRRDYFRRRGGPSPGHRQQFDQQSAPGGLNPPPRWVSHPGTSGQRTVAPIVDVPAQPPPPAQLKSSCQPQAPAKSVTEPKPPPK